MENSVSLALGKSGPGFTVEIGGEQWTLHPLSQSDHAHFEMAAKRHAYKILQGLKSLVDANDYEAERARLFEATESGEYEYGGEGVQRYLRSYTGRIDSLRQMMVESHPDITAEQVEKIMLKDPDQIKFAIKTLHPNIEFEDDEGDGQKKTQ